MRGGVGLCSGGPLDQEQSHGQHDATKGGEMTVGSVLIRSGVGACGRVERGHGESSVDCCVRNICRETSAGVYVQRYLCI